MKLGQMSSASSEVVCAMDRVRGLLRSTKDCDMTAKDIDNCDYVWRRAVEALRHMELAHQILRELGEVEFAESPLRG